MGKMHSLNTCTNVHGLKTEHKDVWKQNILEDIKVRIVSPSEIELMSMS